MSIIIFDEYIPLYDSGYYNQESGCHDSIKFEIKFTNDIDSLLIGNINLLIYNSDSLKLNANQEFYTKSFDKWEICNSILTISSNSSCGKTYIQPSIDHRIIRIEISKNATRMTFFKSCLAYNKRLR